MVDYNDVKYDIWNLLECFGLSRFGGFMATSPPNAHEDHFGSAQQREVKRPRPTCGRQFPDRAEGDPFVAAAGRYTMLVDMPLNCMPPTTDVAALQAKRRASHGLPS